MIVEKAQPSASPLIVLVYGHWDMLFDVLATYHDTYPNIWVVDNHSPVDRGQELTERFPNVRLMRTTHNGGWAFGYNTALRLAASEGFKSAYLLNSDAAPLPGAVESALATLASKPRAAAVGSIILDWTGQTVEYNGTLYLPGEGPSSDLTGPEVRTVPRVHGAGMAISLDAIKEVGYFHEDYFLYHEETDWLIRVTAAGWSLWADGKSKVRHMAGGSDINSNARYYLTRNRFVAFKRGTYLSGPGETLQKILWQETSGIYNATADNRLAIEQGIVDGLRGKTGPRGKIHSKALIKALMIPLRIIMKVRAKLAGPQTEPAARQTSY